MKLYTDFFDGVGVIALRQKPDGDKFCLLLLQLMLKSVDKEGVYPYEGVFQTIEAEIAARFYIPVEFADAFVAALVELRLAERVDEGLYFPMMTEKMVGSEGASAERVRNHRGRERDKALQCNGDVTNCNVEKSREDKSRVDERESTRACADGGSGGALLYRGRYKNVRISDAEYAELCEELGGAVCDGVIERLSVRIEMKGYKYQNHAAVIREWARVDAAKKGDADSDIDPDEYLNAALARSARYYEDHKSTESAEETA